MGGSGAKNRRRQQRGGQRDESNEGGQLQQLQKQQQQQPLVSETHPRKKVGAEKQPYSSSSTAEANPTETKKRKKNFKKPKHLKRKLQALGDDNDEKQKILRDMKEWEQQKQSHKNPERTKNKKWLGEYKHEDSKQSNTSEHPTRTSESRAAQKEIAKDFPRSGNKKQKSDPVVVNGDFVTEPQTPSVDDKAHDGTRAAATPNNNNNDSDSEESVQETAPTRKRGKRRRGRKDTSKKIQEDEEEAGNSKSLLDHNVNDGDDDENDDSPNKKQDGPPAISQTESASRRTKNSSNDDGNKRYCIGRKPVTDFVIGNKYEGTVVYVKPFGVFFDVGCHSDAFCHVSRLQDDYVESAEGLYKEGDKVDARVIEIDRKLKRITVSLQSEARMEDERQSVEARKERRNKHRSNHRHSTNGSSSSTSIKQQRFNGATSVSNAADGDETRTSDGVAPADGRQQQHQSREGGGGGSGIGDNSHIITKPESEMTAKELKRARKLARRAERRAEREGQQQDQ